MWGELFNSQSYQQLRSQTCHPASKHASDVHVYHCNRMSGYSLAANHLVLVELPGQQRQRWLNDATPQPQHQVKRGLCTFMQAVWSKEARKTAVTNSRRRRSVRTAKACEVATMQSVSHPSECCSLPESGHPQAACRQR